MKHKFTVVLAVFFISQVFLGTAYAQQSDVDMLFNKGLQKYLRGDIKNSIVDLEKAIKLEPNNDKVKKFLVKSLVEQGTKYYDEKDYVSASPLLKRAYELTPSDAGVKDIYLRVDSSLKAQQEEARIKEEETKKNATIEESKKKEQESINAASAARRAQEQEVYRSRQAEESRSKEERILKLTQEGWEKKLAENARKEAELEKLRRAQRTRATIFIAFLLTAGMGVLIYTLFTMMRRINTDELATTRQEGERVIQLAKLQGKEMSDKVNQFGSGIKDILTNQMEKVLKMMEEQSRSYSQETIKMEVTRADGTKEIMTDVNPHVRARANGVELIEQTIDDPATGEKLMEPFLSDIDSRVRANAAKGMYKYNKEKAMVVLTQMCKSSDQWMRLSGAWAIGEVGNDIAIENLLPLLGDPKDFIVKRAIKSLEEIIKKHAEEMDEEQVNKIERRIKDARIQRKIRD